jgi:hypothetical protein
VRATTIGGQNSAHGGSPIQNLDQSWVIDGNLSQLSTMPNWLLVIEAITPPQP